MKRAAWALCTALVVGSGSAVHAEPLSDAVVAHVLRIRANDPALRDDAFSKMGGSSVESKAFLHCFASPYVDLGDSADLEETIAYFDTGLRNSFNRRSEAAGVSWNLRYVLGGRPANFRKELGATQARWALVLFGGNDAQNQNERVYIKRLVYLVEELEEMGVVPVLGSAAPRRGATKNRWIRRFNAITEAVALHWKLPYVEYYAALDALPRKGLARDGVHPNVLPPGGLKSACQLTERGLRYGNNVRNLLTLQMLDELRQIVATATPTVTPTDTTTDTNLPLRLPSAPASDPDAGTNTATGPATGPDTGTDTDAATGPDADADADTDTDTDAGTDSAPSTRPRPPGPGPTAPEPAPAPDPLPLSFLLDKPALPSSVPLPARCGSPKPGSRQHRTRLTLPERTRFRASALDLDDGQKARLFLVRIDEDGERCIRRRTQTLEVDVPAGMWELIVEVQGRAAEEGRMLVLIARDPR